MDSIKWTFVESVAESIMSSPTADYVLLPPRGVDAAWRRCNNGLAGVGLVSLVALSVVCGMAVLEPGAPTAALMAEGGGTTAPSIGGECKCSSSAGSSCCCCSHCGCGVNAPAQEPPRGETNGDDGGSHGNWGGNWDIDVGPSGVGGGGYCQCNGQCCCCSSCDCTGPGAQLKHSNLTISGGVNCVGVGNCNSDLPARRSLLSRRVEGMLEQQLRRRRA